MDVAMFSRETLTWACVLIVGFPLAMVGLGEAILRLRRAGRPLAATMGNIRSLVLPILAFLVLLIGLIGLPPGNHLVQVVLTLLWIAVIHTTLSFIDDVVFGDAEEGSWQSRVPRLFLDLMRFLLVLVGGAVALSTVWGLDLGRFVAALGVGSLVLGLALQEPLGNIFAGVMLMFERPFTVGDWIKVDAVVGRVIEINWRAVHLETGARELLVVPNSKLAKETFSNFTRPTRYHTETIDLGFSYGDPPNRVKAMLAETALATSGVIGEPAPKVFTAEYQAAQIAYKVIFTVAEFAQLGPTRDEFVTRVWYAARRHGLTMPNPSPIPAQLHLGQPEINARNSRDPAALLAEFPQFALKDAEAIARLAPRIAIRAYGKGETVASVGDHLPGLHLVLSGEAGVSVDDGDGLPRQIARVGRGEFFGETSVLSGRPSEGTITALEDLEVMVLDSETLQAVLDRTPRLAREIGGVMDVRRRATQAARSLHAAKI